MGIRATTTQPIESTQKTQLFRRRLKTGGKRICRQRRISIRQIAKFVQLALGVFLRRKRQNAQLRSLRIRSSARPVKAVRLCLDARLANRWLMPARSPKILPVQMRVAPAGRSNTGQGIKTKK